MGKEHYLLTVNCLDFGVPFERRLSFTFAPHIIKTITSDKLVKLARSEFKRRGDKYVTDITVVRFEQSNEPEDWNGSTDF